MLDNWKFLQEIFMSILQTLFLLEFEILDDSFEHTWMKPFPCQLYLLLIIHRFLPLYHFDLIWEIIHCLPHCHLPLLILHVLDFSILSITTSMHSTIFRSLLL